MIIKKSKYVIRGIFTLILACTFLFTFPTDLKAAGSKIYQYDTSGRLISITTEGFKITMIYDKNGNLLKRSVTSMNK